MSAAGDNDESVSQRCRQPLVEEQNRQNESLRKILSDDIGTGQGDPQLFMAALHALLRQARDIGLPEESIRHLQLKLARPTVQVAVIALVKSGKSTVLNALLGTEFLPSAAEPATASIVRIVHRAGELKGRLVVMDDDMTEVMEVYGRQEIHTTIKSINDCRRADPSAALTQMRLEVSIPFLGCETGEFELQLVDTPGPNEHGAGLESQVNQVLQHSDVIVYMLDFTKLGTNDEARMFEALKDNVTPILQSSSNVRRIFYILNKVDMHSKRNDRPMDEIVKSVAAKVQQLLPVGATVSAKDILPMSASTALLARQLEDRIKDRDYLLDYLRKAMGECFEDELDPGDYEAAARKKAASFEKKSGFADLEKLVISKVVRQKHLIGMMSFLDLLTKELTKVTNERKLQVGAATANVDDLKAAMNKMQETRESITRQLQMLEDTCKQELTKTQDSAEALFQSLRTDVEKTLDSVFKADDEALQGEWIKPFLFWVKSLVSSVKGGITSRTKEGLLDKVNAANSRLAHLLASKMELFRSNLNAQMHRRQDEIHNILKEIVKPLFVQLAVEAGGALKVLHMKHEELTVDQEDFGAFEKHLQGKMAAMVEEKREQTQKTRPTNETKHGVCGRTWVETRDEAYFVTEASGYSMSADNLKNVWAQDIGEKIEISKKSAELLIEREVRGEVERVRVEVKQRCDKYVQTIEAEARSKEQKQDVETERIDQLKEILQKTEEFFETVSCFKLVVHNVTLVNASVQVEGGSQSLRILGGGSMDLARSCGFEVPSSVISSSMGESKNGLSPAL